MLPGTGATIDSEAARTAQLADRIVQRLAALPGAPVHAAVREIRRLGHGAHATFPDSWKVTLAVRSGDGGADVIEELVLRGDAGPSLPGTLDRAEEFAVVLAAASAGVKTPVPRWPLHGLTREGSSSYFVPYIAGEPRAELIVAAPEFAAARQVLPVELAREAAKIHAVTATSPERPTSFPGLTASEPDCDAAAASLAWLRGVLDGLAARRPAIELAFDWLVRTRPPIGPVVMVHGDFRVGNFLVAPVASSAANAPDASGPLLGILGWDFAHWGAPEEDLAWLCLRSFRLGQLARPVGGIGQREPFYRAYSGSSGRTVDPSRVHWWEVLGNCRWAVAGALRTERLLQRGVVDVEITAMGRRTAEIEWEALRLIELATDFGARSGRGRG